MAPKHSAEVLVPTQKGCDVPYEESRCVISLIPALVTVLLAVSECQSTTYIKYGVFKWKHIDNKVIY